MEYSVVIDAGHGGADNGAIYNGRKEKDDNLRLALAVGDILSRNGVDVTYTRVDDTYDTPFEKATMGNNSGADLFLSIHRNSGPEPNTSKGVETLVFNNSGIKASIAENINSNLSKMGYGNRGVIERPNLVVLKTTKMPAVLVEAGFINNDDDNRLFDEKFEETAQAIAQGVLDTLGETKVSEADDENKMENEIYRVQVGAFKNLENAVLMEQKLRKEGYNTFIVY